MSWLSLVSIRFLPGTKTAIQQSKAASHGGEVSLIEFNDKSEVILQFGGGCQGCGMIDVTLKDGIEKTLVDQLPEITAVKDITDHSQNENAYYSD